MKKTIDPQIDHEVLSLITNISYSCVPAWYGGTRRNLKMDMIAPKNRTRNRKLPLIVWFCGGGFRVVDRAIWLPEMMHFARNGYIVASVEYRTCNEEAFPGALIDAKAAIRYLKAHAEDYCIDPERICVMGESAGGTLASLAALTGGIEEFEQGDFLEVDSSVNAVIDFYGSVDLVNVTVQSAGRDVPPWLLQDFLGIDYTEDTAAKASAVSYVSEKTPPVLIFHGSSDTTVPIAQSERFYEELQKNHVDSSFYVLNGAGHGEDCFYQEQTWEIMDDFLKRVL